MRDSVMRATMLVHRRPGAHKAGRDSMRGKFDDEVELEDGAADRAPAVKNVTRYRERQGVVLDLSCGKIGPSGAK